MTLEPGYALEAATTTLINGTDTILALLTKDGVHYFRTSTNGGEFAVSAATNLPSNFQPKEILVDDGKIKFFGDHDVGNVNWSFGNQVIQYAEAPFDLAPPTPLGSTEDFFNLAGGKTVALAQFALAAYKLAEHEPADITISNIENDSAELIFSQLFHAEGVGIRALTTNDLPSLELSPGPGRLESGGLLFPVSGLENGIYTNGNAAALVARSEDGLFLAFRGTNDTFDILGDHFHWSALTIAEHYQLFRSLLNSLSAYVQEHSEIEKIYVTGHSLGAAMVHSPRLNGRHLYALESGRGTFGYMLDGKLVDKLLLPGFTRGLNFYGEIAAIGFSKLRSDSIGDLPISDRFEKDGIEASCGFVLYDTSTSKVSYSVQFSSGITELYDVAFMEGTSNPRLIHPTSNEIAKTYSIGIKGRK